MNTVPTMDGTTIAFDRQGDGPPLILGAAVRNPFVAEIGVRS